MKRREFSQSTKDEAARLAGGVCCECGAPIEEFDHDLPCGLGGGNGLENCTPLCKLCHKKKTKQDKARMDKADRQRKKHRGERKPSRIPSRPMPGTKASGIRKPMNGKAHKRCLPNL